MDPQRDGDPTLVRNQPALKAGSAAGWLIPAGLLMVIAVGVLVLLIPTAPAPAWIGIALLVGMFAVMCATARMLPRGRSRSLLWAVLMAGMAVTALVVLLVIRALASAPGA